MKDIDEIVIRVSSKEIRNYDKYPLVLGRILFCYDTLQIYRDTRIRAGTSYIIRRDLLDTLIVLIDESSRLSIEPEDIKVGWFYFVSESNILYHTNRLGDEIWEIMYQVSAYEQMDNNYSTKNIFADSLRFLVEEDENTIGSLIINPMTTQSISPSNSTSSNMLARYHEFGKMIFNGDIYLRKNGMTQLITDDGCIDF